jgi:hypothetical protein
VPVALGWGSERSDWLNDVLDRLNTSKGEGWMRGFHPSLIMMTTSNGRLLSGNVKGADLADGLREVLQEYAELPEADRRAKTIDEKELPVPELPAGGIVLTVYDRLLGRDADGQYRLPKKDDCEIYFAPGAQRSSLIITQEEWKALLPASPKQGETYAAPAKLTRRIWLFGLYQSYVCTGGYLWPPDSVRAGELNVTVEEVSPKAVRLRLHGSVLLSAASPIAALGQSVRLNKLKDEGVKEVEARYDARLEGTVIYDPSQQKIVRWDMTALGDYTGICGNMGSADDPAGGGWTYTKQQLPVGFAFEIDASAYQLPAERRRPMPIFLVHTFRGREHYYWDPLRWEEDEAARRR